MLLANNLEKICTCVQTKTYAVTLKIYEKASDSDGNLHLQTHIFIIKEASKQMLKATCKPH
jgi:hypothetical protein